MIEKMLCAVGWLEVGVGQVLNGNLSILIDDSTSAGRPWCVWLLLVERQRRGRMRLFDLQWSHIGIAFVVGDAVGRRSWLGWRRWLLMLVLLHRHVEISFDDHPNG